MEKLKKFFKTILEKFKLLSKGTKIALIIAGISIVIAIGMLIFYNSTNKYKVLFSDLEPNDAQIITNQLKEDKVDMKIEGNTILVNKNQVDGLRLELAPKITGGSKGYELMDDGSSFGITDEEFKLKKQRMLQGELERTIKSFPQVNEVRVHITPAKDSVFVEEKEPGKAAVILNVNGELKLEQIKSIVSLVSGSTQNIPKENVEVIDQNMNLLSAGIDYENGSQGGVNSLDTQYKTEKDYEGKLQKEIIGLLEPVVGKGNVKATVNADLDFDSKQKTETIIDPNKVIVSQQTISENNNSSSGTTSESPVDNNMSNTIENGQSSVGNNRNEQNTNYESGKTETKTISAPGEVKRLTASVIVDGNLDQRMIDTLTESVENAIGLNSERGDKISLASMNFDPGAKLEAQKQLDELNAQIKRDKIKNYVMIGLGIVIAIILIILIIKFINKKKEEKEERMGLNVVVGAEDFKNNDGSFKPIEFNNENEKVHLEKEIQKYAKDKPEQVVEVIKSWLSENER